MMLQSFISGAPVPLQATSSGSKAWLRPRKWAKDQDFSWGQQWGVAFHGLPMIQPLCWFKLNDTVVGCTPLLSRRMPQPGNGSQPSEDHVLSAATLTFMKMASTWLLTGTCCHLASTALGIQSSQCHQGALFCDGLSDHYPWPINDRHH